MDSFSFKENYRNEKEIKNCEILIEGESAPFFSYTHKFKEEGTYKITYSFPNEMKNLCFLFCECKNIKTLDFSILIFKKYQICVVCFVIALL